MKTIDILKDTPDETILKNIDGRVARDQAKYIVISFQDKVADFDRKKTVDKIKKYFDIFIILKANLPDKKHHIEEYFSYGVHGLCFNLENWALTEEQAEIITFATELFARGWIFAITENDKTLIEQLLSFKIIPIPAEQTPEVIAFIKSHQLFNKLSPNLKTVPLLEPTRCDYSLADKIKMKMLLETMNLRQKLMIKNIDESFGSSGL